MEKKTNILFDLIDKKFKSVLSDYIFIESCLCNKV